MDGMDEYVILAVTILSGSDKRFFDEVSKRKRALLIFRDEESSIMLSGYGKFCCKSVKSDVVAKRWEPCVL